MSKCQMPTCESEAVVCICGTNLCEEHKKMVKRESKAMYQCKDCGDASNDPRFIDDKGRCFHCSCNPELTEQGDDIEPLVCSVCGRDDAGAGEMDKGVFTCWECFKKKQEPTAQVFNVGFLDFGHVGQLEEMMAMQADFNKKVGHVPHEGKNWKPNMKWLQKWLLCISQETAECMDWLPWKHWSKKSGNKQVSEPMLYCDGHIKDIKLELIDIQHFLLSAFLELRMDADEVYALYCEKMQVNHDRQEGDY